MVISGRIRIGFGGSNLGGVVIQGDIFHINFARTGGDRGIIPVNYPMNAPDGGCLPERILQIAGKPSADVRPEISRSITPIGDAGADRSTSENRNAQPVKAAKHAAGSDGWASLQDFRRHVVAPHYVVAGHQTELTNIVAAQLHSGPAGARYHDSRAIMLRSPGENIFQKIYSPICFGIVCQWRVFGTSDAPVPHFTNLLGTLKSGAKRAQRQNDPLADRQGRLTQLNRLPGDFRERHWVRKQHCQKHDDRTVVNAAQGEFCLPASGLRRHRVQQQSEALKRPARISYIKHATSLAQTESWESNSQIIVQTRSPRFKPYEIVGRTTVFEQ